MLGTEKKWYAIYTKPRWEKKIANILEKKQIICWCPLQRVLKQWSDRKKIVEEPLFKSYVFVKINEEDRINVLITDGAINYVHYLGKPAVIREEEIEIIKQYLNEKEANFKIISMDGFQEKTKVKIKQGVFMDKEGTVLRSGKRKVYVQLQSLGQIIVVEFPVEYLIQLEEREG